MNDHTVIEHDSGETHDTYARRSTSGLAGLTIESDPHFMRRLRTDIVEVKRSQQADDGVRDGRNYHCLRFGFRGLHFGQPIEPVPEIFDRSLGDQPLQPTVRDPERRDVPRMEEYAQAGSLEPRDIHGASHSEVMILNVGTYTQLPTSGY